MGQGTFDKLSKSSMDEWNELKQKNKFDVTIGVTSLLLRCLTNMLCSEQVIDILFTKGV